ncbi:DUF916 domain-containing protein, partial [Micromonospora sp. PSH25]|nr:DUF916 domain-containing protein [Micromonospora foliorum]
VAPAREEGRAEASRETERTQDGGQAAAPAAIGAGSRGGGGSVPPDRPVPDADRREPGHHNRQPGIDRAVRDER